MTSFSHDMMTRGRGGGGVSVPPKSDDVIYEQPLREGFKDKYLNTVIDNFVEERKEEIYK